MEKKFTQINMKDFVNRSTKPFIASGGEEDCRLPKVELLAGNFPLNLQTKKAIHSKFSRSTSDQDEVISKHKVIEIVEKI